MTQRLLVEVTEWYLAFQDGPADNRTFETEEEAKAAWKKMGSEKKGTMVTSRTYLREPKL